MTVSPNSAPPKDDDFTVQSFLRLDVGAGFVVRRGVQGVHFVDILDLALIIGGMFL